MKLRTGICVHQTLSGSGLTFPQTRPTVICIIYWSPAGNIEIFLDLLESKLLDIYENGIADVLLLGDVNIDVNTKNNAITKTYLKHIK